MLARTRVTTAGPREERATSALETRRESQQPVPELLSHRLPTARGKQQDGAGAEVTAIWTPLSSSGHSLTELVFTEHL